MEGAARRPGPYEENANMRARLIALFLLAAAGLSHATANADILRCNDANGNTLYTDSTCPAGMRTGSVTSIPQSCTTEDCERRRENDLKETYERVRAEKEQLAAYTAERHKRETEDRRLDAVRHEAELHSMEVVAQASPYEAVYPAYPIVGIPARCGKHCFSIPQHRRIGNVDRRDHMKGRGGHRAVRAFGNEPLRTLRGTTAGKRAGYRGDG
jgi:hypothetical protein